MDDGFASRAQGCLMGQLAGDSLGSLVEFERAETIWRSYPDGVRELADGGAWGTLAGQPTDDSELALMLARSLVEHQRYDQEAARAAYVRWLDSGPFDCGYAIHAGLTGSPNWGSQANGALMRISPLGIFGARLVGNRDVDSTDSPKPGGDVALERSADGEDGAGAAPAATVASTTGSATSMPRRRHPPEQVMAWARDDAAITHPNEACRQANAIFAAALSFAIATGADRAAVYAEIRRLADVLNVRPRLQEDIAGAAESPPSEYYDQMGWVRIAFRNALWQLLHAETLEEGVVDTVMRGGDTDTNAAICGALLGAVHGIEAVPDQWRNAVLSCRPLRGQPGVRQPRPEVFWPVDALTLALQLAGVADA